MLLRNLAPYLAGVLGGVTTFLLLAARSRIVRRRRLVAEARRTSRRGAGEVEILGTLPSEAELAELELVVHEWRSQRGAPILGLSADDALSGRESNELSQDRVNEALMQLSADPEELEDISDEVCSICLDAITLEKKLFVAPKCKHIFHLECLGKWVFLRWDLSCPNCKTLLCQSNDNSFVRQRRSQTTATVSVS